MPRRRSICAAADQGDRCGEGERQRDGTDRPRPFAPGRVARAEQQFLDVRLELIAAISMNGGPITRAAIHPSVAATIAITILRMVR